MNICRRLNEELLRSFGCVSGKFHDVHARARPIGYVNIAAVVDFNVVGLDSIHYVVVSASVGEGAAGTRGRTALGTAARVVGCGNEVRDWPCVIRVANIENP